MNHAPTMHDRAAAEVTMAWTLREILREPGNRVRNIALASEALRLVDQNISCPASSQRLPTISTTRLAKSPCADRAAKAGKRNL